MRVRVRVHVCCVLCASVLGVYLCSRPHIGPDGAWYGLAGDYAGLGSIRKHEFEKSCQVLIPGTNCADVTVIEDESVKSSRRVPINLL